MFIKHGDGKIVSVLEEEEMTDNEKEALDDLTKEGKRRYSIKKSETKTDPTKVVKRSGS